MSTRNTMISSYHSKARSTHNKGITFFLFWDMDFSIIFLCLDGAKGFTVNSNLSNLVEFQRLHENIK